MTVICSDYSFYSTVWRGKLSADEFDKFSRRACAYIDSLTFGRASSVSDSDKRKDNLAFCICAVTDLLADTAVVDSNGGSISSVRNDGFEVTYHKPDTSSLPFSDDPLYSAALFWLGPTGLLYCGSN